MKNLLTLLIVCFCIITAVSSCSKSNVTPKKPSDSTITKTGTTSTGTPGTTDVYVAGYELTAQSTAVAVYWKNGVEVKLSTGQAKICIAKSIFVSGNDVYVAGAVGNQAVYWKNGVLTGFPSSLDTLQATSIYAANGNVYVTVSQPVYYEAQTVHPGEYYVVNSTGYQKGYGFAANQQLQQSGICVSGTDVYTSGSYAIKGGIDYSVQYYVPKASYWKNDNEVLLPFAFDFSYYYAGTNNVLFSSASAIAVSGSNVYTVGSVGWAPANDNTDGHGYPAYWINGTAYMIGESKVNGIPQFLIGGASCVSLSGSDVYIGGSIFQSISYSACYWKNNGETVFMPRHGDYTEGNAIAVSGSDVYMAGTDFTDNPETSTACYWKNGTEITLPASTATSLSIGNGLFVVKN